MAGVRGIGALGMALARMGNSAGHQAGSALPGGIGVIAGIVLLVPMEAGVPVPIPADLVMLAVGARVGAGDIPLWVGVLAFEAVALLRKRGFTAVRLEEGFPEWRAAGLPVETLETR